MTFLCLWCCEETVLSLKVDYGQLLLYLVDCDSDDSDGFEDVLEKDGYEADIPEHLKDMMAQDETHNKPSSSRKAPIITNHEWQPAAGGADEANDPTTSAATIRVLKRKLR